ncbi:outer membrane protein assembly factor BamD [Fulvivirga sp. M361]|uniref:outer membrane protein assembly factor BamD n=1 Tax=Fulvivirga sp. M361 TaxID=2594266 RepID=UPI00351AC696
MFLRVFPFVFIFFSLVSCSKFRRIEKSTDWRIKYEAALNYYENEDYYRSTILFDQILPIVRGLPEGEKVQFYSAYSQYYQGFYLLASHQFKVFYETYARSDFAIESEFMYAYSLYSNSPTYNLDQTSSLEAVVAMQNFINRHSQSEFREKATEVIDDIQQKLERKGFENARQYYKLQRYDAAVIAFESFSSDFPDSHYNEEVGFLKFVAQYEWAEKSITSKQLERYKLAQEYYIEFIDSYPTSSFLNEAEKKYGNSLNRITELAKK